MTEISQNRPNVEWVFQPENQTYTLAKCGIWKANLAKEVYAKDQVMIGPNKEHCKDVPAFLGQESKNIPQPQHLMSLIQEVSKRMVERLEGCEMVYLASLNESRRGLHFWLIPRYKEHKEFLGFDGFPLIAELRNSFVRREICYKWDMPPKPKRGQEKIDDRWKKYADEYASKFQ